jgi:alanyl-tRNA synthetase
LQQQKERSRAAAAVDTDDWVIVREEESVEFVGYDEMQCESEILRYRKVKAKGKEQYQLVLNRTPFYAESGGQVGDTGVLEFDGEKIFITDTQKENNLIIHFTDKLPKDVNASFLSRVNESRRKMITNNHSATHLLHSALKKVLGSHVNQKGSLVNESQTRFDFSHFTKVSDEEIKQIEKIVNKKIRENILLDEKRNVPVQQAMEMGAMALFGEKYGEFVRVITFDPAFSIELCGGTHVKATGQIGLLKIVSEGAVAAGVRRIEAITADKAEDFFEEQQKQLDQVRELLKNPKDLIQRIQSLLDENEQLQSKIQEFSHEKTQQVKKELIAKARKVNGMNVIVEQFEIPSAEALKNLSFELKSQFDNLFFLAGTTIDGKALLSLIVSDNLVKEKNLNATQIIRELAKEIQGGGGGQPFYATAGGKNPDGIMTALKKADAYLN